MRASSYIDNHAFQTESFAARSLKMAMPASSRFELADHVLWTTIIESTIVRRAGIILACFASRVWPDMLLGSDHSQTGPQNLKTQHILAETKAQQHETCIHTSYTDPGCAISHTGSLAASKKTLTPSSKPGIVQSPFHSSPVSTNIKKRHYRSRKTAFTSVPHLAQTPSHLPCSPAPRYCFCPRIVHHSTCPLPTTFRA